MGPETIKKVHNPLTSVAIGATVLAAFATFSFRRTPEESGVKDNATLEVTDRAALSSPPDLFNDSTAGTATLSRDTVKFDDLSTDNKSPEAISLAFSLPFVFKRIDDGAPSGEGGLTINATTGDPLHLQIPANGEISLEQSAIARRGVVISEPAIWTISANVHGFLPIEDRPIQVQPGVNEDIVVYLERGVVLEGRILDAVTNKAVVGAVVQMQINDYLSTLGTIEEDGAVHSKHQLGLGGIPFDHHSVTLNISADGYPDLRVEHKVADGPFTVYLTHGTKYDLVLIDCNTRQPIRDLRGTVREYLASGKSGVRINYDESDESDSLTIAEIDPNQIAGLGIWQRGYGARYIPLADLSPVGPGSKANEILLTPAEELYRVRLINSADSTPFSGAYFLFEQTFLEPGGQQASEEVFGQFELSDIPGDYCLNSDSPYLRANLIELKLVAICRRGNSDNVAQIKKGIMEITFPFLVWKRDSNVQKAKLEDLVVLPK